MTDLRWAQRLHQHLTANAGAGLGSGPYWAEARGGIEPAARWAYEDLADRGLLHRHVDHVRSSQAFALNLFAPLDSVAMVRLLRRFAFDVVEADPPRFEWEDRHDRLHEATTVRPHRTQVDVLLRGRTASAGTVTVLVEVKLSETDLNACSAYESPHNDTRDNCRLPDLFGGDPQVCFQLRNRDLGPRRAYDTVLEWEPVQPAGPGCAVRGGANQAMRNLALARLIAGDTREGISDAPQVFFALCAPLAHKAMWRRWAEIEALFPGPRVRSLPADIVVAHHSPPRRDRLADRYLLQPTTLEPPELDELPEARWDREWPEDAWRELASWHVATALHERHPGRFRLIETHPGGGQYDCLSLYPPPDHALGNGPVQLNRMGSIHLSVADPPSALREVWERLARHPDTGALVAQIEDRAGLPPASPAEPSLAYRFITAVLTRAYRSGTPWRCVNGYADTSGYGAGPRTELFDQIPGSSTVLSDTQRDDFEGGPTYRCWFLGPTDDNAMTPHLMVESSGSVMGRDGSTATLTSNTDLAELAALVVAAATTVGPAAAPGSSA